jgi:hypothetical protein
MCKPANRRSAGWLSGKQKKGQGKHCASNVQARERLVSWMAERETSKGNQERKVGKN